MKVFIVLAALVAVASAHGGYSTGPLAAVSTGTSSQFRSEDNYGNYNFGYDESHASGGSSRREESNGGVRRGMYALTDADGRRRVVNYVADASGFHANVETNEPGVEPKDPADVLINKNGLAHGPAPVQLAAPLPIAAPEPIHVQAPLPAPIAVKGYSTGPVYGPGPVVAHAPAYEAAPIIAETPRAFSYSFGSTHLAAAAPVAYAPAPVAYAPAPIIAPAPLRAAPVYQQRLEY